MAESVKRKRSQLPDFIEELSEIGGDLAARRLSVKEACARMGLDYAEVAAENEQQLAADRRAAAEGDDVVGWLHREECVIAALQALWAYARNTPETAAIRQRMAVEMRAAAARLLDERWPVPSSEAEEASAAAIHDWRERERQMVGALEDLWQDAPPRHSPSVVAIRRRLAEALAAHGALLADGGADRGKAAAAVAAAERTNNEAKRQHERWRRAQQRRRLAVLLPAFLEELRRVVDGRPADQVAAAVAKLVTDQIEAGQWFGLLRGAVRRELTKPAPGGAWLAALPPRARCYLVEGVSPEVIDWCERRRPAAR